MKTYCVYFRSNSHAATCEFEADSPAHALTLARQHYADDPWDLDFEWCADEEPVDEIEVCGADGEGFATWMSDDRRLRFAARNLLDAAEAVVARWERGDLAAALRDLEAAIAKAKGGAK